MPLRKAINKDDLSKNNFFLVELLILVGIYLIKVWNLGK